MLLARIITALFASTTWGGGLPLVSDADMTTLAEQNMCVEYIDEAIAAGWHSHELPRLMRIMHRESRCIPDACSTPDQPHQRKCRDWGLMQINDYSWKSMIRKEGFTMADMHDPQTNLVFARHLYELSENTNGCGWTPWNGTC